MKILYFRLRDCRPGYRPAVDFFDYWAAFYRFRRALADLHNLDPDDPGPVHHAHQAARAAVEFLETLSCSTRTTTGQHRGRGRHWADLRLKKIRTKTKKLRRFRNH